MDLKRDSEREFWCRYEGGAFNDRTGNHRDRHEE
jgi:hypothetical protein